MLHQFICVFCCAAVAGAAAPAVEEEGEGEGAQEAAQAVQPLAERTVPQAQGAGCVGCGAPVLAIRCGPSLDDRLQGPALLTVSIAPRLRSMQVPLCSPVLSGIHSTPCITWRLADPPGVELPTNSGMLSSSSTAPAGQEDAPNQAPEGAATAAGGEASGQAPWRPHTAPPRGMRRSIGPSPAVLPGGNIPCPACLPAKPSWHSLNLGCAHACLKEQQIACQSVAEAG